MTMRSVQDRFWSDGWVRKLNPLDRYLFLYLLTNEHTNWSGVYELEIGMMAYESGIDREELERSMLPRLSPKVIYVDGWVYVPNWLKHHHSERGKLTPDQEAGVKKAWESVPDRIRLKIKEIQDSGGVPPSLPPPYPPVPVPSASALSSALKGENLFSLPFEGKDSTTESDYDIVPDTPQKENKERKDKGALALREQLYDIFEEEYGVRPTPHVGDYQRVLAAMKVMKPSDIKDLVEDLVSKKRTVREALTTREIDIYLQDNS